MSFISPMNCKTLPEDLTVRPGEWAVEEKFDGHRIVVQVNQNRGLHLTAWSRAGNVRPLPDHLMHGFRGFPNGIYDGELMGGDRSYGVTDLRNRNSLHYVMFDVLELDGVDTTVLAYVKRRALLMGVFTGVEKGEFPSDAILRAQSVDVPSSNVLHKMKRNIWDAGGEGIVLKRLSGIYVPGKRSPDFLKLKKLQSTVCTVVGFAPGAGEIIDRGPYAKIIVRDSAGTEFSVKTLNDEELHKLEMRGTLPVSVFGKWQHPDIGRELRIEFHERNASGKYREPRWDRWEDE